MQPEGYDHVKARREELEGSRKAYSEKLSPDQLRELGKMEKVARDMYGEMKKELNGLGVPVNSSKEFSDGASTTFKSVGDDLDGFRLEVFNNRFRDVEKGDRKRVVQLLRKMDLLEDSGLVPYGGGGKKSGSSWVSMIGSRPNTLGESIRNFFGYKEDKETKEVFIHKGFPGSAGAEVKIEEIVPPRTYQERSYTNDQDYPGQVALAKEIENRAGVSLDEIFKSRRKKDV